MIPSMYWNYKSAVLSAASRGTLFFLANLSAGVDAAFAAFLTECVFRTMTAGFYGGLTERLSRLEPERRALLVAVVVLPAAAHSLELAVHWARGTANLGLSVALSVGFSVASTSFNVLAMRRGVLVAAPGSPSIVDDLRRLPRLVRDLVA